MQPIKTNRKLQNKVTSVFWPLLFITLASCSSGPITSTSTPLAFTATPPCEQTLIRPQITEIQPAQPMPGEEITVIGSGGFIEDSCGGYIEGSSEFTLYLDSEPAGSFSCYINHCEGKFILPGSTATGPHCLLAEATSTFEPDNCPFEFVVMQE